MSEVSARRDSPGEIQIGRCFAPSARQRVLVAAAFPRFRATHGLVAARLGYAEVALRGRPQRLISQIRMWPSTAACTSLPTDAHDAGGPGCRNRHFRKRASSPAAFKRRRAPNESEIWPTTAVLPN
jgi:hypothetical protein